MEEGEKKRATKVRTGRERDEGKEGEERDELKLIQNSR